MPNQLIDFRRQFLNRILDLVWRQWTTAGIAGRAELWTGSVIDPEALFLFSSTISRYDARLFDAIQEWLSVNGNFINVQRLEASSKKSASPANPFLRR